MARYTYFGPVQTISLKVGTKKNMQKEDVSKFEDFDFVPGTVTADLPENNPIVESMVDAKQLVATSAEKTTKPQTQTGGK